jgi:oligopeptide transport system permease protein
MATWIQGSDTASVALQPLASREESVPGPAASLLADAWRRLRQDKLAMLSLGVVLLMALAAIMAPVITPYGYAQVELGKTWSPPGLGHILGTDALGRDVLSRLIYGARVSMSVAFVTIFIILILGVPVGAVAGFLGGRVDAILMRLVDAIYAFPDLLFVIAFTTFYKALVVASKQGQFVLVADLDRVTGGTLGIFVAIGLTYWLTIARVVRGQVLSLKEREFIEAARSVGAKESHILWHHVLPNCLAAIIVTASLYLPQAIMVEASLSFLGLGVNPPMASWGIMVAEGLTSMRAAPYLILAPAAAIAISMLAFNFLGDGLRDALDPYMRQ